MLFIQGFKSKAITVEGAKKSCMQENLIFEELTLLISREIEYK